MGKQDVPLEHQLRDIAHTLDQELAKYAARNEGARAAVAALRPPTWADPVNRLLGEVNHRSGLLLRYRLQDRPTVTPQSGERREGNTSHQFSATLAIRGSNEEQRDDSWTDAPLKTKLPQVSEHNGVSISVDTVCVSTEGIRIHFQLQSDVPFGIGAKTVEDALTLAPILTGVSMTDRLGTAYKLQPAQGAMTARDPRHTLPTVHTFKSASTMEFTPAPPLGAGGWRLTVTSVLVTVQQPYLMTATPARLIDGPWELEFSLAS